MRSRICWYLLLTLLVGACATTAVKSDLTYQGTYSSYERIIDNWTRSERLYKNFATEAVVSATYFSLPMRRVFVAEWARAFDLPAEERTALLAEQIDGAERSVEFVISFYTPKHRYNDLHKNDSSWRLWFIDANGRKVGSSKIERMRVRHRKEYYFFPYYTEWSRLYRVVFPAVGDDGQPLVREQGAVTLRITGVQGTMDLVWEIPPGVH